MNMTSKTGLGLLIVLTGAVLIAAVMLFAPPHATNPAIAPSVVMSFPAVVTSPAATVAVAPSAVVVAAVAPALPAAEAGKAGKWNDALMAQQSGSPPLPRLPGAEAGVKEWEKYLRELNRPKKMKEILASLAIRNDAASVRVLLGLADDSEFADSAIEALGHLNCPGMKDEVLARLRARQTGTSMAIARAAVASFAMIAGEAGVPEMDAFMAANWVRPDGQGPEVCAAAINSLGKMDTPASRAALFRQLQRVSEPGWLPDYGSAVVAALARPGQTAETLPMSGGAALTGPQPPEVRDALLAYAAGLAARMPGPDNPPGRKYYEEKIAEAHQAAAARLLPPEKSKAKSSWRSTVESPPTPPPGPPGGGGGAGKSVRRGEKPWLRTQKFLWHKCRTFRTLSWSVKIKSTQKEHQV